MSIGRSEVRENIYSSMPVYEREFKPENKIFSRETMRGKSQLVIKRAAGIPSNEEILEYQTVAPDFKEVHGSLFEDSLVTIIDDPFSMDLWNDIKSALPKITPHETPKTEPLSLDPFTEFNILARPFEEAYSYNSDTREILSYLWLL